MEWLEFNRWSQDVEQRLATQAARLNTLSQAQPRRPQITAAQTYHLLSLLRRHPSTNPWGHPTTGS